MSALPPLHHVVLSVSDFEKSLAFYTQVLGYHKSMEAPVEGERYERYLRTAPGTTGRMAMLQADDRTLGMIEIIQWDPPLAESGPAKRPGDPGVCMLALELKEEQSLEDFQAKLDELGVPLWSPPTPVELEGYPVFYTLLIEDPDGLLVEIIKLPTLAEAKAFRAEYKAKLAAGAA
jgi:catechol 2,3-dioxygenase-like lactoylglutathione lyase family enzyme